VLGREPLRDRGAQPQDELPAAAGVALRGLDRDILHRAVKASPHAQEIEGGKYLKLMCLGALIGPAAFLARLPRRRSRAHPRSLG
jgi:hypothetical protein